MSELSPREREAMESADRKAKGMKWGDEFEQGWLARREYSKQREEELEHQLKEAKRFHTNEYKDRIAAEEQIEEREQAHEAAIAECVRQRDIANVRMGQAEERERALREQIESAASDASLCDSAEKLEALTERLLTLASFTPKESHR